MHRRWMVHACSRPGSLNPFAQCAPAFHERRKCGTITLPWQLVKGRAHTLDMRWLCCIACKRGPKHAHPRLTSPHSHTRTQTHTRTHARARTGLHKPRHRSSMSRAATYLQVHGQQRGVPVIGHEHQVVLAVHLAVTGHHLDLRMHTCVHVCVRARECIRVHICARACLQECVCVCASEHARLLGCMEELVGQHLVDLNEQGMTGGGRAARDSTRVHVSRAAYRQGYTSAVQLQAGRAAVGTRSRGGSCRCSSDAAGHPAWARVAEGALLQEQRLGSDPQCHGILQRTKQQCSSTYAHTRAPAHTYAHTEIHAP